MSELLSRIPVGGYILLGLFLLNCVVQLFFAFKELEQYRRIQKPFCLLTLAAALVVIFPQYPLLYVGALLAMVGDILVIQKFKGAFPLGALAFFLSNSCYIAQALVYVCGGNLPLMTWIEIVLYFVVMFFPLYFVLFKRGFQSKAKGVGAGFYYSMLLTTLPVFIIASVRANLWMLFAVAGSLFFICSDSLIFYFMVKPKIKRYDFYIMSTYLMAQLFIALGFIFSLA